MLIGGLDIADGPLVLEIGVYLDFLRHDLFWPRAGGPSGSVQGLKSDLDDAAGARTPVFPLFKSLVLRFMRPERIYSFCACPLECFKLMLGHCLTGLTLGWTTPKH